MPTRPHLIITSGVGVKGFFPNLFVSQIQLGGPEVCDLNSASLCCKGPYLTGGVKEGAQGEQEAV